MFAARIKAMSGFHWIALFGGILGPWVVLYLMSAAMMAPTVLPAFATYYDLGHFTEETNLSRLILGNFVVWLGF